MMTTTFCNNRNRRDAIDGDLDDTVGVRVDRLSSSPASRAAVR